MKNEFPSQTKQGDHHTGFRVNQWISLNHKVQKLEAVKSSVCNVYILWYILKGVFFNTRQYFARFHFLHNNINIDVSQETQVCRCWNLEPQKNNLRSSACQAACVEAEGWFSLRLHQYQYRSPFWWTEGIMYVVLAPVQETHKWSKWKNVLNIVRVLLTLSCMQNMNLPGHYYTGLSTCGKQSSSRTNCNGGKWNYGQEGLQ